MRGDRNVRLYVDAKQDLDNMRKQVLDDPTRLKNAKFVEYLNDAKVTADAAFRKLTGGQLARARRILATPMMDETTNDQGD